MWGTEWTGVPVPVRWSGWGDASSRYVWYGAFSVWDPCWRFFYVSCMLRFLGPFRVEVEVECEGGW